MFLECERCGKSYLLDDIVKAAREITDDIRSVAGKIKGNPNEPTGGKSGAMRYFAQKGNMLNLL